MATPPNKKIDSTFNAQMRCVLIATCAVAVYGAVDTTTKPTACDAGECAHGRCEFADCKQPVSCAGGRCKFVRCERPSCGGGLCDFEECHHPSCSGGACHFKSTQTTLKDGFCSGGVCKVDGEVTSSRLKDALAY
mgnify:CR=1 FL=1